MPYMSRMKFIYDFDEGEEKKPGLGAKVAGLAGMGALTLAGNYASYRMGKRNAKKDMIAKRNRQRMAKNMKRREAKRQAKVQEGREKTFVGKGNADASRDDRADMKRTTFGRKKKDKSKIIAQRKARYQGSEAQKLNQEKQAQLRKDRASGKLKPGQRRSKTVRDVAIEKLAKQGGKKQRGGYGGGYDRGKRDFRERRIRRRYRR